MRDVALALVGVLIAYIFAIIISMLLLRPFGSYFLLVNEETIMLEMYMATTVVQPKGEK